MEQEKHQWTAESQLSTIKLNRDQSKILELEERIQLLSDNLQKSHLNSGNSVGTSLPVQPIDSPVDDYAPFGMSTSAPMAPNDIETLKERIDSVTIDGAHPQYAQLNRAEMNKLLSTIQLLDSKAATYQQECNSMRQRIAILSGFNEKLQEDLSERDQRIDVIQEECQTSVQHYETQLATMSEHLANLNDKLTAQQEQIEQLQYEHPAPITPTNSVATSVAKVICSIFVLNSILFLFRVYATASVVPEY